MAQLPQTGIDTSIVGDAIGLGLHDIGLLCSDLQVEEVGGVWYAKEPHVRANRINKWSKWKPINTSIVALTDTVLKAANYGLSVPTMNWYDLHDYILNDFDLSNPSTQIKWAYSPPTGGSSSPYNLGAYKGYQKDSKNPFKIIEFSDWVKVTLDVNNKCLVTYEIDLSQVSGGLGSEDFQYSDYWSLGVMYIDYEADYYPIVLYKANAISIGSLNTIEVDVSYLGTSSYLVCFFLFLDSPNLGVEQLNYPQSSDLPNNLIIPIELGIIPIGLSNKYKFPFLLWGFGTAGLIPPQPFDSTGNYQLKTYTGYTPIVNTNPYSIVWGSTNQFFELHPDGYLNEPPSLNAKWTLRIGICQYNNWIDGVYRTIVSWRDPDVETCDLQIKTIDGYIWIRIFNSTYDYVLEESETFISLPNFNDGVVDLMLANYSSYAGNNYMSVWANSSELFYNSEANAGGTPELIFGGVVGSNKSPYGLAFKYIEYMATGNNT